MVLGADVQDEKLIPELVSYFQAPILARLQSAINVLKNPSRHQGRLFPGRLLVR
jgi:hypothetical protein